VILNNEYTIAFRKSVFIVASLLESYFVCVCVAARTHTHTYSSWRTHGNYAHTNQNLLQSAVNWKMSRWKRPITTFSISFDCAAIWCSLHQKDRRALEGNAGVRNGGKVLRFSWTPGLARTLCVGAGLLHRGISLNNPTRGGKAGSVGPAWGDTRGVSGSIP